MKFSEFCKIANHKLFKFSNQIRFAKQLFESAKITKTYSDDYLRSLYTGKKPMNSSFKKYFSKTDNSIDSISEFYKKNIDETNINTIADGFNLPKSKKINIDAISYALAYQVLEFIKNEENDIKNIVLEKYKEYINGVIIKENKNYKPRYEKDEFYVSNTTKQYNKSVYKKFKHTWKIQNRGKNIWTNRKLVLTNNEQLKLDIIDKIININETKPYDFVTIEVEVATRGYEGNFTCEWELQDEDGYNCFENTKDFNFEIIVKM